MNEDYTGISVLGNNDWENDRHVNVLEVLEDSYFGCMDNLVHLGEFLHLVQTWVKILYGIKVIVRVR